jgi:HTH-type transcriptional regulator / antitoxin HigA
MATAIANLDAKAYGRLLARALPHVVETEEENEEVLGQIHRLLEKGEGRSPEERVLTRLLVLLVEDFERRAYTWRRAEPHEVLGELMRQHELKQADLVPLIGSKGHVSDVLSGKKSISRKVAVRLAERFHVTPDIFLAEG